MKFKHFAFLSLTAATLQSACNDAGFKGKVVQRKPVAETANATPAVAEPDFAFSLGLENGAAVIPQRMAGAIPGVLDGTKNMPLSEADLASWQVKVHREDDATATNAAVSPQLIDLTASLGLTRVVADFASKAGKTGNASQVVYVDGEAPVVKLLRISDAVGGLESQILWSATDNYKLDEKKIILIACSDFVATLTPRSRAELNTLPANCLKISEGADLLAKPSQIAVGPSTIAGLAISPKDLRFFLYAEDMVGLSAYTWMTAADQEKGLLVLNATPTGITFTNKVDATINLKLVYVKDGLATQIDDASNSALWPSFDTLFTAVPAANAPATAVFKPSSAVKLGPADGNYSFQVQAQEHSTGIQSNKQVIGYVLDTIPPKVDILQIVIDKNIPSPQSTVTLSWNASDLNGISSQSLEVKGLSDTVWTKVADLPASARTFAFAWGNRTPQNFQLRINATDPAGNTGNGAGSWAKQIFNAAVLTSSVQCYFCHIKIIGDVGGIDFPASVRSDSGENFDVVGKLFGTNKVPDLLGTHATAAISNYDNNGYKIFPKDNKFPILAAADLKPRMTGTLTYKPQGATAAVTVTGSMDGNLVLDGTDAANPIRIKGEVFINGDLIIKGKYVGIGSIYAQNIYIVGDLVANTSPFPFPEAEADALAKALSSVLAGNDALYLGSLNQLVVGTIENRLQDEIDTTKLLVTANPYSWKPQADFNALGAQAVEVKFKNGTLANVARNSCCSGDPTTDIRFKVEVNRVDAYLYSQQVVSWRAYANILLNGGFMSPKGGFVTTVPSMTYKRGDIGDIALNPRNGLPVNQNMIRYDYRLKVGGAGFETLKSFFDQ